jgi:hypothetical protein
MDGCMPITFPRPDRSNFTPNVSKTPDNDVIDLGWNEGMLSDGRPYRFECWCQDQLTCVTFFVSSLGLEQLDRAGIQELLEREHLVHFLRDKRYADARPFVDPSGNTMLSINVVVGDDEETFSSGGPLLIPYAHPENPESQSDQGQSPP